MNGRNGQGVVTQDASIRGVCGGFAPPQLFYHSWYWARVRHALMHSADVMGETARVGVTLVAVRPCTRIGRLPVGDIRRHVRSGPREWGLVPRMQGFEMSVEVLCPCKYFDTTRYWARVCHAFVGFVDVLGKNAPPVGKIFRSRPMYRGISWILPWWIRDMLGQIYLTYS